MSLETSLGKTKGTSLEKLELGHCPVDFKLLPPLQEKNGFQR
jgi:hypothetical protein